MADLPPVQIAARPPTARAPRFRAFAVILSCVAACGPAVDRPPGDPPEDVSTPPALERRDGRTAPALVDAADTAVVSSTPEKDAAPRDAAAEASLPAPTDAGADARASADASAPTFTPTPTAGVVPVVLLEVKGQTIPRNPTGMKVTGRLKLIEDHDGNFDWRSPAKILARPVALDTPIGLSRHGNASDTFAEQKPYNVEFRDDAGNERKLPLLGMPADADWVLGGCWVDRTCMKHALVYETYREMGRWAARFRWVETFLDGSYVGMHLLSEKIRRGKHRVNIPDPAPDAAAGDVTGGYIWKIDSPLDGPGREWKSVAGIPWSWYRPKWDEITAAQKAYLQGHLNAFDGVWQGAAFADPQTGYRAWLDVPSWVDYLLIDELSMNTDGLWRSAFFHKGRKADGDKIVAGPPWDYDLAFGVEFRDVHRTDAWQRELVGKDTASYKEGWGKIFQVWDKLWADPDFRRDLKCRWLELRKGPLALASLHGKLDAWTKHIGPAEKRHHERYKVIGIKYFGLHVVGKTWLEDVAYLKSWIAERLKWMDANLPGTCPAR